MVGQDENFLDLKKQKQEKFLRWNMVFKQWKEDFLQMEWISNIYRKGSTKR